jgi:hypothetical protein
MRVFQELGATDQVAKGNDLARRLLEDHRAATVAALSGTGQEQNQ